MAYALYASIPKVNLDLDNILLNKVITKMKPK